MEEDLRCEHDVVGGADHALGAQQAHNAQVGDEEDRLGAQHEEEGQRHGDAGDPEETPEHDEQPDDGEAREGLRRLLAPRRLEPTECLSVFGHERASPDCGVSAASNAQFIGIGLETGKPAGGRWRRLLRWLIVSS